MKNLENCTVYEGSGRFAGPHTVTVGSEALEAERIFINVGARAFVPPMPGLDEIEYLTNSNVMDVDFLPEHLIVIGGSYIGLEFGQMYRRFGSEVTVVQKGPRLIPRDDPDVSETVKEIMESEGINIRLEAEGLTAKRHEEGVQVSLDCDRGAKQVVGSHLLLAVAGARIHTTSGSMRRG